MIRRTEDECFRAQQYFIELLNGLGFAIKWEKAICPTNRATFLGLIVDSKQQCLELSADKWLTLSGFADSALSGNKARRKELEMLAGHMAFDLRAIYGARPFVRLSNYVLPRVELPNHMYGFQSFYAQN